MSKAILLIDMPSSCSYCDFCHTKDYDSNYKIDGDKYCCIKELSVNDYYYDEKPIEKPNWCPLKPLPKMKIVSKYDGYCMNTACTQREKGWNDCLDKILSMEKK